MLLTELFFMMFVLVIVIVIMAVVMVVVMIVVMIVIVIVAFMSESKCNKQGESNFLQHKVSKNY